MNYVEYRQPALASASKNPATESRRNLLTIDKEHWKPPVYQSAEGIVQKWKLIVFRFLDLQAATIWHDLADELPSVKGTVLDVGCGIQPFRHMFSKEVRYIGLDSSDSKAHFGYETPDTLYYSGPVWPLSDATVDFILCTETLEHILEPGVFLGEAFRCLKPGGRLLLTVPFAARWHFIPYDYWRYTPSGLNHLLTNAGFAQVRVFARGNQLTVACYKVMAVCFTLLLPVSAHGLVRFLMRVLGVLCVPILLGAAVLAHLSLRAGGSVDCIGYTAFAEKVAEG
jgi:SAM-dependent methyltransferase